MSKIFDSELNDVRDMTPEEQAQYDADCEASENLQEGFSQQ